MWEGIIFHSRAEYVVHCYSYVLSYIGHKLQTFGSKVSCVEEGSELPCASHRQFHKAVKQPQKRSLRIRNSARLGSLWCLRWHIFRRSSGCEVQEARLEPPPWKETLNNGGDTSEANAAMGKVHQGRDTVKGQQPVENPAGIGTPPGGWQQVDHTRVGKYFKKKEAVEKNK